jgi:hypothetical protein
MSHILSAWVERSRVRQALSEAGTQQAVSKAHVHVPTNPNLHALR